MKTCKRCQIEKDESSFSKKERGLQPYCKNCQSEYQRAWYRENADKRRRQIHNRQRDIAIWVNSLKTSCSLCGENRPEALDFHHRDMSEKEIELSAISRRGWSKQRILREMEKCDIVCSNCHRVLHKNRIFT